MLYQTAVEMAKGWVDAWNRHDLAAIMVHYAETIEFTSPFIIKLMNLENGTIRDKVLLKEYFGKGLATYPDLKFELITVLSGVDSLVIYYRSVNDLLAAEWMHLNTGGLIDRVIAHYSEPPGELNTSESKASKPNP